LLFEPVPVKEFKRLEICFCLVRKEIDFWPLFEADLNSCFFYVLSAEASIPMDELWPIEIEFLVE